MERCPKCNNWTLEFDDYFGRFRCFDADCGWMAPSSVERALRLQRSYTEPTSLGTCEIKELGITVSALYDKENDALVFDFGLDAPTFELPEPDGRMVWKIARITGSVAGFLLLGAREFGLSEVKVNFDARKADIEEALRLSPESLWMGRATRVLIRNVEVTAHSRQSECPGPVQPITEAFKEAATQFEQSINHRT